ncbi:ribbon-helix-helix domain-containing protein, partial [Shinella granuli]|uniref:ribbon-helix-helix domain-containing protein n=1 Tax=Shinella granuli TaxID=323621 RepID=UPI0031E57E40
MCRVLTTHSQEPIHEDQPLDPDRRPLDKRTARIRRFWDVLEDIASREGLSTAQLIRSSITRRWTS